MDIDDLEIDPQLFIRCRLCITQSGKYQIVPEVQEKIKYCFDIEVKPYDGLSQLICKSCSETVNSYSSVKKCFIANQQALKQQKELKKEKFRPELEIATIEEPTSSLADSPSIDTKAKKKRNRIISSSSSSNGDVNDQDLTSIPVLSLRRQSGSWVQSKEIDNESNEDKEPAPKRRRSHLSPVNSVVVNSNPPQKLRMNTLKSQYYKKYVCRICKRQQKNKPKFMKHLKTHMQLLNNYKNIFQTTCSVRLEKFDEKPNFTGLDSYLIYDSNLIIKDVGEVSYHEIFSLKNASSNGGTDSQAEDNSYLHDHVSKPLKRKIKHRLLSESSTDTVVMDSNDTDNILPDNNYTKEIDQNEVIDIDDSSNDSSRENERKHVTTEKKNKSVHNIVSMCLNRHIKKLDAVDQNINKLDKSQLKSKVLNFGRKVINKQGLSCTLLLRYLEHKNLDIKWSKGVQSCKEGNDYVRVMTRVRVANDDEENANVGWKNITPEESITADSQNTEDYCDSAVENADVNQSKIASNNENPNTSDNQSHKQNKNEKSNQTQKENKNEKNKTYVNQLKKEKKGETTNTKLNRSQRDSKSENDKTIKIENKPVQHKELKNKAIIVQPELKEIEQGVVESVLQHDSTENIDNEAEKPAVLTANMDTGSSLAKLLNETPVANPRQLSKRAIETKYVPSVRPSPPNPLLANEEIAENNLPMPIIAFTQSLATNESGGENPESTPLTHAPTNAVVVEKPAPRIKVKPPSELMSERVLNNMSNQQSFSDGLVVVPQPQTTAFTSQASYFENTNPGLPNLNGQNNLSSVSNLETVAPQKSSKMYVLDTPELPNMATSSPFIYFQNLLQLHSIVLETEKPSVNYNLLIKFKSKFSPQNAAPLVISLALFCLQQNFYLQISINGQELNLSDLPAHWQWEILKLFQTDVASKIIGSSKKVGLYDVTYRFVSLLKSIKVVHS